MTIHILSGAILLAVSSASVGLMTAVLWNRLRTGVRHFDLVLFPALWFSAVTMLVMCACALGILTGRMLCAISLVGACAAVALFRRDLAAFLRSCRSGGRAVASFGRERPGLAAVYAVLASVLAVRAFLHAWLLPPYVWDTLVYHLPRIAEWIQNRGLFVIDTPIDRLYWPANFELFQCWFVVFFHHDFLVELAGVVPYALAVLSVYSICRSFGVTSLWSSAAAAIFSTTPTIVQSAVTCKNDIAIAAWFLFMAAAIAEMARNRGPLSSHARFVAILALAFGVALGSKPYIVFVAPGLALLYVLLLANGDMRAATRSARAIGIGLFGGVFVCSLFIGLFWYVRNGIVFGNPFHPSDFRVFGHVVAGTGSGPEYAHSEFRAGDILASLWLLRAKVFDPSGPYVPELPGAAGWGWFAVACGLPAAVTLLFRPSPSRLLTISCVVSLCCLFGFVLADPWNLRYALWFPAIFPVAFAILVPSLGSDSIRGSLALVAAAACVCNLVGSLNNGYCAPSDWRHLAAMPIRDRTAAQMSGPNYLHALREVPKGETIGYDMHPNGFLYPLYGADYAWTTKAFRVLESPDVLADMRSAGVRYLFCPYQGKMVKARLKPLVAAGRLRERGWGLYERTD